MARFSKSVLDKFLAPRVSKFRGAEIPDLSDKSSSWLAKFYLNSVLRGSYRDPYRQYIFNYLRRVEAAHAAHKLARDATLTFLSGSRQSISRYMDAILHWESFLAQSWMACALIGVLNAERPFKQGDGSVEEKINLLHNRSKHAENAIDAGQLPPDGSVSVWMENDGLHGLEVILRWEETGEMLHNLSNLANILEDPCTAADKLKTANQSA